MFKNVLSALKIQIGNNLTPLILALRQNNMHVKRSKMIFLQILQGHKMNTYCL
jgi:hypothetical protein